MLTAIKLNKSIDLLLSIMQNKKERGGGFFIEIKLYFNK